MADSFEVKKIIAMSPRRTVQSAGFATFCLLVLILVATCLALSPVLSAGFLSRDDGVSIQHAAQLSRMSGEDYRTAFQIYSRPSESAGLFQPLTLFSLAMDVRLTKDPDAPAFQFHLTNLALHLMNVALVFLLLSYLISSTAAKRNPRTHGTQAPASDTGGLIWAAVLALVFGLHPIQTETVAWISQRGMLLGTFFSLIALHAYVRHLGATHRAWLVPATICYLGAVLSMPIFIGLPVLLLILDLWPARRDGWQPLIEKLPMFVILFIAGIVMIAVARHIPPRPDDGVSGFTLLVGSVGGFVERIVWPMRLAPYYPIGVDGGSTMPTIVSLALTVLLIGAAVWSFRRSRPLFLALSGMLLILTPALQNVAYSSQLLGDRFLYAALLAPLMAWAAWLPSRGPILARPAGRLGLVAMISVVCLFAVQTFAQTFTWQSSRDLYEFTIARYPAWPRGYTGLVEAYLQENEYDSALYYAEKAARIAPDDPTTQFYLGTTLLLHHGSRSAEAVAPLEKALRSNPNWIACLQNLGVALARSGQSERAIEYLEKARDLEPESPSIRIGLGHAYLRVQRPASARRELQEALRHQNNATIHLGLAMAWAANESPVQARRHLATALARDPKLAVKIAAMPEFQNLGMDLDIDALNADPLYDLSDPATIGVELPAARNARGI